MEANPDTLELMNLLQEERQDKLLRAASIDVVGLNELTEAIRLQIQKLYLGFNIVRLRLTLLEDWPALASRLTVIPFLNLTQDTKTELVDELLREVSDEALEDIFGVFCQEQVFITPTDARMLADLLSPPNSGLSLLEQAINKNVMKNILSSCPNGCPARQFVVELRPTTPQTNQGDVDLTQILRCDCKYLAELEEEQLLHQLQQPGDTAEQLTRKSEEQRRAFGPLLPGETW